MTLTCRSQWITMPGHTINKLLTPPDFLQHPPVPHVEKSSHAYCKTSDHLHAVKSVIDYGVKEPHISKFTSAMIFWETYGNMGQPSKICLMCLRSWTRRNTVVKFTPLARLRHCYSSLQIWTRNRCCLSIPNNRHEFRYPWKCWCTGKVFSAAVKAYYFGEVALLI